MSSYAHHSTDLPAHCVDTSEAFVSSSRHVSESPLRSRVLTTYEALIVCFMHPYFITLQLLR